MPDSRPESKQGGRMSEPLPESTPEPPPPLPVHNLVLHFEIDLTATPLPAPPELPEGAERPDEEDPPLTLDGTHFVLTLPAFEEGSEPVSYEIAHPLSGEGAPDSSSADIVVTDAMVTWLVVEQQGALCLSLRRRGADEEAVCELAVDVAPLVFGKQSVRTRFEPGCTDGIGLVGEGVGDHEGPVLVMPKSLTALATSCAISVRASTPILSPELQKALNPMAVTLIRADGMPATYSGTPFKRPYEELADRCSPVYVSWELLGTSHTCAPKPHGASIVWNERRLLLVGSRVVPPAKLAQRLRQEGLRFEVHDRDPLPPTPPPAAAPASDDGGADGAEEGATGEAEEGGNEEEAAQAPAADAEPESAQFPPFGVARTRLAELIPRRPTDAAVYAPGGIPVRMARRSTLELEVVPCERPKKRPEPEEVAAEYYAGPYLESGTELTVNIELAVPLEPEEPPKPTAELQRIVTLIRYNDTPMLLSLLNVIKAANDAIGMNSASAWESYKEEQREDLDLITGLQLVDGDCRLFILEGLPATTEPLNAMGRLGAMLERKRPNSATAFTLMNTSITFPARLYNNFEMPTKLIKLRATLPHLLQRPEIYQYLRVAEGTQSALICLGQLLSSSTLRYAHKAQAFPEAGHLLQLEKKFGAPHLIVDREGVVAEDDDDVDYALDIGSPSTRPGSRGRSRKHKHERRKAQTDADNEHWFASLKERETREPIDWLAKNIAELPHPPTPQPLAKWYLDSIPRPNGPVYMYSGQRLNQTEIQKKNLREQLTRLHKDGKHMSYNRNFLWADSVGDREERLGYVKPDADLVPWDSRAPPVTNKDGTLSSFRLLQPSDYRTEELSLPWDEEALLASRRPVARADVVALDATGRPKPRFDPNPTAPGFLEEFPEQRFRSIFQQTEEGMAAEHSERVEGAIETWKKKLVVDDPVLRIDMRVRDRPLQTDKFTSTLKDAPMKRSLKSLYRGKTPMTRTPEPSAFMHEATVDGSLLQRGKGLRATWSTQRWPHPQ
jgi:hypothetical protein